MIHDLARIALKDRKLEIYQGHFKRTFIHVDDVARAFIMAIEKYDEMRGEIYNVGNEGMNYTKMEVNYEEGLLEKNK